MIVEPGKQHARVEKGRNKNKQENQNRMEEEERR